MESSILEQSKSNIIITLFYGNDNLSEAQRVDILKASANYLMPFMHFEQNLYNHNFPKIYINKEVENH